MGLFDKVFGKKDDETTIEEGIYTVQDSKVDIIVGGINFKIPEGFKEDVRQRETNREDKVNGLKYISNIKSFEKDDIILVFNIGEYQELEIESLGKNLSGNPYSVNGMDGKIYKESIIYVFNFVYNEKVVVITSNKNVFDGITIVK